jgi:hypothetical protein
VVRVFVLRFPTQAEALSQPPPRPPIRSKSSTKYLKKVRKCDSKITEKNAMAHSTLQGLEHIYTLPGNNRIYQVQAKCTCVSFKYELMTVIRQYSDVHA